MDNVTPSTLVEVLARRAADTPDGLAFQWLANGEVESVRLTWGELDRRARVLARDLETRGMRGRPALLLFPEDGLDFLVALFGCFQAGVVAIPAPTPRFSSRLERLRTLVEDARPALSLTTKGLAPRFRDGLDLACLALEDCLPGDPPRLPLPSPDDLAYLQYTSGSTSSPRGCRITHRNLLGNLRMLDEAWEIPEEGAIVSWLPLFHDMGLVGDALHAVLAGCPCILMGPLAFLARPMRWLEAISRFRAFSSGAPDFAYDLCVRRTTPEERARLDLRCWKVACNAAEPVRASTLERFAAAFADCGFDPASFRPSYGLAEATAQVTTGHPTLLGVDLDALGKGRVEVGPHALVGAGTPWAGCRVEIVDPESARPCPPNRIGEIWVAGPHVAEGYQNRPQESERVFRARLEGEEDLFLRTGDLGFQREGVLFVTGRLKDVLILNGQTFYPQDLERTAESCHEAFRPGHGAAFPIEVEERERVAFAWELASGEVDREEAVFSLRRALAAEHGLDLQAIALVRKGTLPRTSSGKVQRHACRQRFLEGGLQEVSRWTASAPGAEAPVEAPDATPAAIQAWILSWIQARVGLPCRDPERSLLDLGLNSLAVMELVGELERRLDRPVAPLLPWAHPTPGELAAALSGESPPKVRTVSPGPAPSDEPVAVIGMACRFPGGVENPESLWELLSNGREGIGEVPPERDWPGSLPASLRRGGFLSQVDRFDSAFFGLDPAEADSMDPQQRLLMEVAWEALEDAGVPPGSLRGSATGVFVGLCSHDYETLLARQGQRGPWTGTGNAASVAAGRLSYHLGVQGPSLAVDTACSSSLVAVHLAVMSLRAGESRMALAGGANLVLLPDNSQYFHDLGALARDGRCKSFDAAADGYVRSEGAGMVILKPLSAARRDGDRVLAVIRGSATNQDGRSNGLTSPNGRAQEEVLRQALQAASLEAPEVGYVEAHGAGTRLGDPIELHALDTVLGPGHCPESPLRIGSIKTNLGHTEAAAGVAGLIKAVLILQHGLIPASLNLHAPTPLAPWDRLQVPVDLTPWPCQRLPRVAGVSAFGLAGTNAHVLLEEAPLEPPESPPGQESRQAGPHLLPLSARSPQALADLAGRYHGWLERHPEVDLADLCHTAARGRDHHPHRVALVVRDRPQLLADLAAIRPESGTSGSAPDHLQQRAASLQQQLSRADDRRRVLEALGALYQAGAELDWEVLTPRGRRLPLPTTPWQRSRHWFTTSLPDGVLFHEVRWDPVESPSGEGMAAGLWLLLGEGLPGLERALRSRGASTRRRPHGSGFPEVQVDHVVFLADGREVTDLARAFLSAAQDCVRKGAGSLWLVTRGAQGQDPGDDGPWQAPLWGLARTVAIEHPEIGCRRVDLAPTGTDDLECLLATLLDPAGEDEFRIRGEQRAASRLVPVELPPATRFRPGQDGTWLVTGGTGGLGLALAGWLVGRGVRHLVLVSRRGADTPQHRQAIKALQNRGARVRVARLDVTDRAALARLLEGIRRQDPPLRGVFHLAGLFEPALLANEDPEGLARTMSAKVQGAWNLHELTAGMELEHFVFYSSVAATLSSPGQGAYAAANAFLDALACWRRARGLPATALAWTAFRDGGMAVGQEDRLERLEASGMGTLRLEQGLALLDGLLASSPAHLCVLSLDLRRWLEYYPQWETSSLLARPHPPEEQAGALPDLVASCLARVLRCPLHQVDPDRPFRDQGMDSLRAVELRNLLQRRLRQALPVTLAFEHPTVLSLAAHLAGSASLREPSPSLPAPAGPVAIVGMACRFPGGAQDPEAFWEMLMEGRDAVGPAPPERSGLAGLVGGFLPRVDLFAAEFFGIEPAEAELMDPQHRLLLETAWQALASAGLDPGQLQGRRIGVFVGISSHDYATLVRERGPKGAWNATGLLNSVAAGRISYTLGLEGPAMVVDTACSSSLLAVHLAAMSLQAGECDLALAGGVNLILTGEGERLLSDLGALSPTGRCRSFSEEADGFVRSEGCGVVLLKPLDAARRDADPVRAVVRGSAVNQDGRSNGLAAPRGAAQEAVLLQALARAALHPSQVGYVEAHGTGTPLGDPIELGALDAVLGRARPQGSPLRVGSVKSNLGHTEAAAGVAGLIKTVLALEKGWLAPNLHLNRPNSRAPWKNLRVPTRPERWPGKETPRVAGVSAFGLAGTNVHVLLEEAPADLPGSRPAPSLLPGPRRSFWFEPLGPELHRGQVSWTPISTPSGSPRLQGAWALVGGPQELRGSLTRALEERGARILRTHPSRAPMTELADLRGVVALSSLEAGARTGLERGLVSALEMFRALARRPTELPPPQVWLVSRGAWSVHGEESDPFQAPLWGLGRTLFHESPELSPRLVDLDPHAPEQDLFELLAEIPARDAEAQVAWRNGVRYGARLVPCGPTAPPLLPSRLQGSILLTGGLGALGRRVAGWLAARGAARLVLAGRRQPTDRDRRFLESLPVPARFELLDVRDPEAIRALLARLETEGHPVRGLIHAAGVLDDALLVDLDETRLGRALEPSLGAWNLHQALGEVDFFVLFASLAGLMGNAGQAGHAAAGAFLDALAAHRCALGRPALALDWGPWSEGMGAGQREHLTRQGLEEMPFPSALEALEELLGSGGQRAVLAADWKVLGRWLPAPLRLFASAWLPEQETPTPPLPAGDLEARIRWHAARLLGVDPEQLQTGRPLREQGLDSLRAVELRNLLARDLCRTLPATLAFDQPSVAAIATWLKSRLGDEAQVRPGPMAARGEPAAPTDEPIAVVGMGCRLPGSVGTPEELWELLMGGRDPLGEVPPERWEAWAWTSPDPDQPDRMVSSRGGFLSGVDLFDAAFFGIAPREARMMDPQQRLVLETAWEALEDAGIPPGTLAGSRGGVFLGLCTLDYAWLLRQHGQVDPWSATGSALAVAAGRLSYTLGLEGPSLVVDTACSSSLLAVHLACQSLRQGESTLALAGGVNLILCPETSVLISKMRALSGRGRCATFDAEADGYVRSEGCGVVVLKTLSAALRDQDRVLAVIRASASGQDGRSNGLTAPRGPAQEAVLRRALAQAGLSPDRVGYVEAHGAGTPLSDPMELQALDAVLGPGRSAERPLVVGALKSNLGHTEGAAGVAGLIKAVLVLQHGRIPANLHFQTPNPLIPWADLHLRVAERPLPWPAGSRPRIAGVNAFGVSGTNVHVLLEEAPTPPPAGPARPDQLLPLSARDPQALRELAGRYARLLRKHPTTRLADLCHTAGVGREPFEHRLALVCRSAEEAVDHLEAFASGLSETLPPGLFQGRAESERPPRLAMLFTGQGSQIPGMGRDLDREEPVFRAALERCSDLMASLGLEPLREVLFGARTDLLQDPAHGQPALFSLEYALWELVRSWGVEPSALLGHSLGELVAACAAEVLSLEDALRLVAARGRLVAGLPPGAMVALWASEAQVLALLEGRSLSLAAVNSPLNTVVSGSPESVEAFCAELESRRIRFTRLPVAQAGHSPHLQPAVGPLREVARTLSFSPPRIPLVSGVSGRMAGPEVIDPEYWVGQLLAPVRFADGIHTLAREGLDTFLELGPQPALSAMGAVCLLGGPQRWLATLRPGQPEGRTMRMALAELFVRGGRVDHAALGAPDSPRRIALPTYPFQRERFWFTPRPTPATPAAPVAPSPPP